MHCFIIHNDVLIGLLSKDQTGDSLMVQALDCLVGGAMLYKLFDVLMSAETCVHVCMHLCLDLSQRSKTLTFSYGANLTKVSTQPSVCGYSYSSPFLPEL